MGNFFLFDLKNKCRQNKRFFNDLNIPLCTLCASSLGILGDVARPSVEMVSRFLGFSVSPTGIWSLGANMDGHNACPLCAWHRTWRLDSSSTTL